MTKQILTQARLKELLHYNPETGDFTWLVTRPNIKKGDKAGSLYNGHGIKYWSLTIGNIKYIAHRIAWFYIHGEFPPEQIDHIDGNGLNNKITNLRCVSHAINQTNKALYKNNTSGHVGVNWNKHHKKWLAQMQLNGDKLFLGYFANKLDAIRVRKMAEYEYGFHENHGRS